MNSNKNSKSKRAGVAVDALVRLSDYRRDTIAAIKKAAGGTSQTHILPRAYCVAKPAAWCAVFAVPPQDREPQVKDDKWTTVQNESAAICVAGEWYSLAYVTTSDGCGGMRVIQPNVRDRRCSPEASATTKGNIENGN